MGTGIYVVYEVCTTRISEGNGKTMRMPFAGRFSRFTVQQKPEYPTRGIFETTIEGYF